MVKLEPEEVSGLRREERKLPGDFPMLRELIHKLESLSASGQPGHITVADPATEWLTSREVADMFRISERTVRHWCEEGHVRAIRTPGKRGVWRIRADQFAAPPEAVHGLLDTVKRINQRFEADPPEDYER